MTTYFVQAIRLLSRSFSFDKLVVVSETTTPPRMTRPSADATRERILAAALDLFSEQSFEGATTREIAARAGVTQPLLNYHFSSKDELWRAAVDGLFDELDRGAAGPGRGVAGRRRADGARLVVREFIYFSAPTPAAPDHHPGVQDRRAPHGLARGAPHPAPVRVRRPTLFARLVERGQLPDIPVAAPVLHRDRGRSDHVRARPPSAGAWPASIPRLPR